MSNVYDLKFEIPISAALPDSWNEDIGLRLPPEFVVSRRRDNSVASRRGDIYWDWSAYHPRGKNCGFYFSYWLNGKGVANIKEKVREIPEERASRVTDIQHLMTLMLYKKPGRSIGFSMLNRNCSTLCHMAAYADRNGLQVPELLSTPMHLRDYIQSLTSVRCSSFYTVLALLYTLDPATDIGFSIASNDVINELRERVMEYGMAKLQTPPIPTRIYSAIISGLSAEINDFEKVADRFLRLTREFFDRSKNLPENGAAAVAWQLITRYQLDDYFEAKGLQKSHSGISRGLNEVQTVCKLTIQAFSGMRHQEGLGLPYHCMETEKSHGRIHFILCGQTTKLNHGKIRRTKWVTIDEGHRAVIIAQRIAGVIYEVLGDLPKKSATRMNKYPLFVSTGYLGATTRPSDKTGVYQTMDLGLNTGGDHSMLRDRLRPVIEDVDLAELEDIDPHRAWRSEPMFRLGQPWVLRSHQFRRSLALYAQRSGLVSLPSLRRQLQHITKEMSLYYSKGSVFAMNFIEDDPEDYKKHMAKEWRDTKPVSEALAFLRDVVFSDEELFGGAGAFEQQKKNRGQVTDRVTTMRQFKKGLIAYKEIPFGGCIRVGDCDKVGLKLIGVLCLSDCKNIVVKMSRMDTIINRQSKLVASIDSASPTYRMEKDDLDAMLEARNRWVGSEEGVNHG